MTLIICYEFHVHLATRQFGDEDVLRLLLVGPSG